MAFSVARLVTLPLLLLNLSLFIVVLGLSGHFWDEIITNTAGGNDATPSFVVFSLIAGVVGCASVIAGLYHLRIWKTETLASANAVAWVSWSLLLLAMGLAWKEIHEGGRSTKHRVLEAFVIILSFTQLFYIALIHLGCLSGRKYGPVYEEQTTEREVKAPAPAATTSPAAASAV